jgi:thymidylate synthase
MKTIEANCVDEALFRGLTLLESDGIKSGSRNGEVLVMPCPVMTVNNFPMNRVSFNERRNANPFFHLMEALWMLAGRNDADWLDQFVSDFSSRFAEERDTVTGKSRMHGAYGYRWRHHFDVEGGGELGAPDQLERVVSLLKANPDDRRVVITMWDPVADLGKSAKDIPCNTHIYCRVRNLRDLDYISEVRAYQVLDLTVCCRSNDAIWGCHGANAVHFSVLQEYLAARIGIGVGKLYQLSNNYHAYTSEFGKVWPWSGAGSINDYNRFMDPTLIVTAPDLFDLDLAGFFGESWLYVDYSNPFFHHIAVPMRASYVAWRKALYEDARRVIHEAPTCDWIIAATNWYHRKMTKRLEK